MSDRLSIKQQRQDGVVHLRVSGVIDEDNHLDAVAGQLRQGDLVVIDTREVSRINSCGVRDWINWLSMLDGILAKVVLVNCSVHIVDQINMVHNFIGSGKIKSFFAPYYCEGCDEELLEHLEVSELSNPLGVHPRCPRCNKPTELDHLPEQFFAFLEERKRILLDPESFRRLAGLSKGISYQMRELDSIPRRAAAVVAPGDRQSSVSGPPLPRPRARATVSEQTGPDLPRPRIDTDPARELPADEVDTDTTGQARLSDEGRGEGLLGGAGLSPLATMLLVAGIVVVLALMFLLVFRSW